MSEPIPESLALIAGKGAYPVLLAESARKQGVKRLFVIAFRGETDRAVARHADEVAWIYLGQLGHMLDALRQSGVRQAVMAGQITPTHLFRVRMDGKMLELLRRLPAKNAETIFGAVAEELKTMGIELLPASTFMEAHMPKAGLLSAREPSESERRDIELGRRVARATSGLDIGQTVVMKEGVIMAVEAFEGTDETIERAARLGGPGIVIVKVAKQGHDMRFDIPVIGLHTLKVLRKARAAALAVEAGRAILLEREKIVEEIDRMNMAMIALEYLAITGILENPMDKKLKVGVFGVGSLGQHHARIYSELPCAELVGVYDVDAARADEIAAKHNTKAFATVEEFTSRVEAASVAVPTDRHFEVASLLMNRGLHLMVEKPIAATTQEASALVALAARTDRILQVGHVERFNPVMRYLEDNLTQPRFIEAIRLATYPPPREGARPRGTEVSVVLDLMIHDLDIILHLVKAPLKDVHAVGLPVLSPSEDIANVRLTFANGCVANVTASRISRERMRKIRVFQEDTYVSLDYMEQTGQLCRKAATGITAEVVPIGKGEPLADELESFVLCVLARGTPVVTGQHASDALKLAVEICRRIREDPS